jgi:hypothetical protein
MGLTDCYPFHFCRSSSATIHGALFRQTQPSDKTRLCNCEQCFCSIKLTLSLWTGGTPCWKDAYGKR